MTDTEAASANQVVENGEEQENEEDSDPFLTLIKRGDLLRKLRELEVEDEAERQHADSYTALGDSAPNNDVVALEHGVTLLRYESFLSNQRYYDDYKHVDNKFIDYSVPALSLPTTTTTTTPESADINAEGPLFQNHLIIEQDKTLGKGGFCWDCAHILGDFIIQKYHAMPLDFAGKTVIELGTGTGLCGLMIAKAVDVHVSVTDLPQLLPLLKRNVVRNFDASCIVDRNYEVSGESKRKDGDDGQYGEDLLHVDGVDNGILSDYQRTVLGCCKPSDFKQSKGRISCFSLDWDEVTKSSSSFSACNQTFDIVLGAELVASLYDPIALAHTIHALTHDQSTVYIGMKDRLDTVNRQFEAAMCDLFVDVETNIRPATRNRNPYTWILIAKQRKEVQ